MVSIGGIYRLQLPRLHILEEWGLENIQKSPICLTIL